MALQLNLEIQNDFAIAEYQQSVERALGQVLKQAEAQRAHYAEECHAFEVAHNMTSDEYLSGFESGELGDDEYLFNWYAAKRGFDYWDRECRILSQISVVRT